MKLRLTVKDTCFQLKKTLDTMPVVALLGPREEVWAIEVKCTTTPKIKAAFHTACVDVNATK